MIGHIIVGAAADACRAFIVSKEVDLGPLLRSGCLGIGSKPAAGPPEPVPGPPPPAQSPAQTAPPPTAPTPSPPSPSPPSSYRYYVYGTCADGACGLRERAGPGYSTFAVLGVLYDGDPVDIVCQTSGELATPNAGVASNLWDKLVNGSYVTDVYVTTPASGGSFTAGIPRC